MAAKPKRQVSKARGHRAPRHDFARFYEGHSLGTVHKLPPGEIPPWQKEILGHLNDGQDIGYIARRIGVREEDIRRVIRALEAKGLWDKGVPEVVIEGAPWDAAPGDTSPNDA